MIKDIIRQERQKKGLSQEQLGDLLGMTKTAVSSWERGVREPQIDTINKLIEIFDCTADYLLGKTDNPQAKVYKGIRNGDEITVHIHRDYPHNLTPQEVEKLLDSLAESGFNVEKLIEKAKK